MLTLTVVVPAYNEEDYIGSCLKSLESFYNKKFQNLQLIEILVVNNASTDKTVEIAKKFPHVKVVTEKEKGLTKARQRGLIEAKGELIAYVDADTHISDRWYESIEYEFVKHPDLQCLSGPYIYYDISPLQKFFVKLYWNMLARPVDAVLGYMVVGGNFVARRQTILDIGGFDTTISFYGEDTNIGRRIHSKGRVIFSNSFIIYTSGRRLISEGIGKVAMKYGINFLSEALLHFQFNKKYKDIR